jgi:nucleotide-binding universal stress UspA family protein
MSNKIVLVALDAGPRCAARVALAARLAARHGSHLIGLAPTGLPDVIVSMNSAVPDAVACIQLSASFLRGPAGTVARAFEQQAAAAGVASFEARVVEDEPLDAVVRVGRCCDLVVVGQTDPRTNVEGVARDFPQQVVLHTGTPVPIVPFAGSFAAPGQRVAIAWKGTREAARALHDALPLLRSAAQHRRRRRRAFAGVRALVGPRRDGWLWPFAPARMGARRRHGATPRPDDGAGPDVALMSH